MDYDQLASDFDSKISTEIGRLMSLLTLFSNFKHSSRGSLNTSLATALASEAKDAMEAKTVTVNASELEPIIREILQATLSSTKYNVSQVEIAFNELIQVIGLTFLINRDSSLYVAQIVARRLIMLITFLITLLQSQSTALDELEDHIEYLENIGGDTTSSTTPIFDTANYMANKMREASVQITKLTDAVLAGKLNPTSGQQFQALVDQIFNMEQVDKYLSHNDPYATIKKLLLRTSYATQVYATVYSLISQWPKIISEFTELNIQTKFAKSLLDLINNRLAEWETHFESVSDQAKLIRLKELLMFLSSADTALSNIFTPPTIMWTTTDEGRITWLSDIIDSDSDPDTSAYLENPGTVKIGDKLALDSPTLDSDGLTVPYHTVQGVGASYIMVDPPVERPPYGADVGYIVLSDVAVEQGATYAGKYQVLCDYLTWLTIPKNLELAKTNSDETSQHRKFIGGVVWEFIGQYNSEYRSMSLSDYQAKKAHFVGENTALITKLTAIKNVLLGYSLPQLTEIDNIDDILNDHGLDLLREHFINGRLKDFFQTTITGSSRSISLATQINQLIRSNT